MTSAATLPNLIIAGVRKGGTTSLAQYLAQHPDICSSALKKVGYFLPLKYGDPLPPLDEYASHFEHCGGARYRMEATTGYFLGAETIAPAIAEMLPDARVLVSLRDPVDALWSNYRFVRSHARIPADLTFPAYLDRCRAMMAHDEDLLRENNAYVAYRGGFYDRFLPHWIDALGDRFRVVYFDDLGADSAGVVADVCSWLGTGEDAVSSIDFEIHNRSVQVKNHRVQKVALRVNRRAKKTFRKYPQLKRPLRSAYYAVNRDRGAQPRLDADTRRSLQDEYAASNAAVAVLLGDQRWSGPPPAWLRGAER